MAGNITLAMIKPKAVESGHTGAILHTICVAGFKIRGLKMMKFTKEQAEKFYEAHKGKDFYKPLIEFITSGPVVVACLEGPDAVNTFRELMGATDPKLAAPETIRGKFGTSVLANAIHGSDSDEAALREIEIVFDKDEIF
jgi:nucleoside-diphosphate kinase